MWVIADTETSGLLKRGLPLHAPEQPWIVSISAEHIGPDRETISFFSSRIRAEDGRLIEDGASGVHGISSRSAARHGVPAIVGIGFLCHMASDARYVVGWGLDFDRQIVEGELIRRKKDTRLWTRPGLAFVDLMKVATNFCRIPHPEPRDDNQWKWPSLDEACEKLLGEERRGQHHGWDDVQRTKRLFFWLLDRGAIEMTGATT